VGGNANCLNVTLPNGTVVLEKEKLSPRFSVEVSRSFLTVLWIRIRIVLVGRIRIHEGKKLPTKIEIVKKFYV
jgi:hypothetical protein